MEARFKDGVAERLAAMRREGQPVRVELGCGPKRAFEGAITVDRVDLPSVDVVADMDAGLPFADASVDAIFSSHFLEHVADLGAFTTEMWRVLAPGGTATHVVPHFSNPYFYSDYTHRTFFGLYTFNYFSSSSAPFKRRVPHFYNDVDFRVAEAELRFKSPFKLTNLVRRGVQRLVNLNRRTQEFYEDSLSRLIPAYEIRFVLVKE
ncbi:MAG: methyltransferase domain-containing protein [Desulfovibrionaceae bacterium]